jgi:hypothetical protein
MRHVRNSMLVAGLTFSVLVAPVVAPADPTQAILIQSTAVQPVSWWSVTLPVTHGRPEHQQGYRTDFKEGWTGGLAEAQLESERSANLLISPVDDIWWFLRLAARLVIEGFSWDVAKQMVCEYYGVLCF